MSVADDLHLSNADYAYHMGGARTPGATSLFNIFEHMANTLDDHLKIIEKSGNFRDYLIPLDHPRLHPCDRDARVHSAAVLANEAIFLVPVARGWIEQYKQPYHGFTTDGNVVDGLWKHNAEANGPTREMVNAARHLTQGATQTELSRFSYPIHAREWRSWSNPEVIIVDTGLRLEEMSIKTTDAVYDLLKASLSDVGYKKIRTAMLMNGFLGQLTNLTNVLSEHSYHFCLFGEPSLDKPWGFNLFGHHLCLNVFVLAGEAVVGPFFIGAEPNVIDEGTHEGTTLLHEEESAGFAFMQSLTRDQQAQATLQGDINDIDGSTMPKGRWNPADLRGLGGAYQDNRIVPFEGLCAVGMTLAQQQALLQLVAVFNTLLPAGLLKLFLDRVHKHIDQTYFAWIGPVNDSTPFYYRIHSPVIMIEFDHHNGVWLANALPKKYHIHTIQRLPNRGDYGAALYDEWRIKTGEGEPRV